MEQWKQEDKERLNRLSEKIEAVQKQPIAVSLPPIKAEDLAPYVNEIITEYVAREIKPALDAIADAVNTDSQQSKAEFNKLIERVVTKTYDLVQMALKANGLVPQIVPLAA